MSTTGHERCLPSSSDRKTPKEVVKVTTEEKYEVELSFRNVCHTLLIDLPYVAERQNEQNTHIGVCRLLRQTKHGKTLHIFNSFQRPLTGL